MSASLKQLLREEREKTSIEYAKQNPNANAGEAYVDGMLVGIAIGFLACAAITVRLLSHSG